MKTIIGWTFVAGIVMAGTPALADSAEAQARSAINQKGHACPQVTHLEGVGMVASGDALIGATCSDGKHWVLRYNSASAQIVNVLECWALIHAGAKLPFCE